MAQFRGTIEGQRGPASRLGSKKSGLSVTANGWSIGATVRLVHNDERGEDEIDVCLTSGSHAHHAPRCIFTGTASEVLAKLTA